MNFGLMDWRETFFSASGRLARAPFLIATAILMAVVALYQGIVHDDTAHWLTGWFVYLPALFCGVCIVSKRLHDRGRSGWWLTWANRFTRDWGSLVMRSAMP